MKRNFLKTKIIKVNRVRVDKMIWNCPSCTFENENTEDDCKMCGETHKKMENFDVFKKIFTTDIPVSQISLQKVIQAIRDLFIINFSVHIIANNNRTIYQYKGTYEYTIVLRLKNSHYTLVTNLEELNFGQYNLASDEKDSGDDAHKLPKSVRDNYNNFLKSLGVVEKKGNCCFPKCLLMALFMKEFKEEEEKLLLEKYHEELAAKLAQTFQQEEEEKLLLEKHHGELAAKLAQTFQQEEEEDAKFAERFAKMGLSG